MITRRFVIALALAAVAWPAAARAQAGAAPDAHQSLTVGTATAHRGEKATGVIHVPAGSDPALDIPVVVVNGAKPGPVLALVAGLHGTEYASIIALEQLIGRLDPARLSGSVIVVPLVNVPSFEQIVPHVNPYDHKSMNGSYPGKADGTQTDRASYAMTKEVVDQCDYLIDLHGGDIDENLRPYSYLVTTGRADVDRVSREMVLAFGIDHIILADDWPKDPAASRYLHNTALTRGKPSIAVEAGHSGTVEPDDVALLVRGCEQVMRYLHILPGTARSIAHPVWIEKVLTVSGEQPGIFYPLVARGTYVASGMRVGYVTDFVGRTLQEVRAPAAGVVMFIRAVPSVWKGASLLDLGVVKEDSQP
ncbi:MAG: succinylglutamate desuccinylase/aspartoacylase family protein [Acidobacteriota bacterium]|nr:succinylglutamate desuccinylase/aspartoacylase family protein [Acidobacteriota bacterium]